MKLAGLQKLTLIDYPGKVAATVFTIGCNFRCHFCHNPELVLPEKIKNFKSPISEVGFFEFLQKRKNKLDGVCITGGEPTIQSDLEEFIEKIRGINFLVKLDSNGTNPRVLEKLIKNKKVDFIAMDIKTAPEKYQEACGIDFDINKIKESVDLIRSSEIDYEFRTTVVPGIHQLDDFEEIGKWLSGAKAFSLQEYQDAGKILNEKRRAEFLKQDKPDLKKAKAILEKYIKKVVIK